MSNELNYIVKHLERFDCMLVGSRFMGFHTEKSDYDYLAEYSDDLIVELERLGFTSIISDYYDNIFDDFYRVILQDGIKIEVQIFESSKIVAAVYGTYIDLLACKFLKFVQKPYRKIIYLYQLYQNIQSYAPKESEKLYAVKSALLDSQEYYRQELNMLYDAQN